MPELSFLIAHSLFGLFFVCALALWLYAVHAYWILWIIARNRKLAPTVRENSTPDTWPDVVTQIPLYNEANVAERVMRAVAAMEYPGCHTVQVLDDSTDETCAIVDAVADDLRCSGCDVEVVRRSSRTGFKAGALAEGMRHSTAPFLAVFDADFVPSRDFLLRTVGVMQSAPQVGFVQGRWTFLNEGDSILTRAQAIGLDSHFVLEQNARGSHPSLFMNFNGTAGVWRREAIDEAGGWSAATLTEDLDLSYRVQLCGWNGVFLKELQVPGELPATLAGFKSQQFRWAKGSAQTAIRLLPALLRAKLPIMTKVEAFVHLTHYAVHLFLLVIIILVPLIAAMGVNQEFFAEVGILIAFAAVAPAVFYAVGQALLHPDWPIRLLRIPAITIANMGLAISNARAVLEAIIGRQSSFIRTPKSGDCETRRYRVRFPVPPLAEIALGVYAGIGLWFAVEHRLWGIAYFCLLAVVALTTVGMFSLRELWQSRVRVKNSRDIPATSSLNPPITP